jgi:hypothetical protein
LEAEPVSDDDRNAERWDALVAQGKRARLQHDAASWALGDLARDVVSTFGEGRLAEFAEAVDIGYEDLERYHRVAGVYSTASGTRAAALSWSHYRQAAAWPDREQWLARATSEGWTLRQLATEYDMAHSPQAAEQARQAAQAAEVESIRPALLERFGADFVKLVDDMRLPVGHLRELLDAPADEQQLAMAGAWMQAAAKHEAEWAAQSRRSAAGGHVSLARYMEIRLASPRAALKAQQDHESRPADPPSTGVTDEPTPAERLSAQRRIRLEQAIVEARSALGRIQSLDQLVEADRRLVVAELEEVMSLIGRRLQPGG